MSPDQYRAQKETRMQSLADNAKDLGRLDKALPMTKPWDATGFWGGVESGEGAPGWSPIKGIGGTSGYDLNAELQPVRSNATLRNMLKLKAASQTGATGLGQMSDTEGRKLETTDAVLDTRQSRQQLQDEINASREALIRHTPGLHPSNPIDLASVAPTDIPDGAYFKGPDGRVYVQKHGAGAPGTQAASPPVDPRTQANDALKKKSAKTTGTPQLLSWEN
jgi:hypothetical protein